MIPYTWRGAAVRGGCNTLHNAGVMWTLKVMEHRRAGSRQQAGSAEDRRGSWRHEGEYRAASKY